MQKILKPGDVIAMREIYDRRGGCAQPAIMVKDSPDEVAFAMLPGAEWMALNGSSNSKDGNWRRRDFKGKEWELENFSWHPNRLLILREADKYYATIYFWQENTVQFLCYYNNFQLPFLRSECGFDSLDLEFDIAINPQGRWSWKDEDEYQKGIGSGVILKKWMNEIELAKPEIFEMTEKRKYPLEGKWLDWKPKLNWPTPILPTHRDQV